MKRKLVTVLLVLGVVLLIPKFAAATTRVDIDTHTASADLSGWETVIDWEITLHNITDDAQVSSITWTGITYGDSWEAARQYAALNITATYVSWGLQVYTDNQGAGADPAYTGDDSPAGLIGVSNADTKLNMSWNILANTTDYAELNFEVAPIEDGLGWGWKWMKDKSADDFISGEYYITVWNQDGILWGEEAGERGPEPSPNYMYLGANFTGASAQEYKTNRLMLEFYTD